MAGALPTTQGFQDALNDYFFLLNQGYPEKQSLKLVGDRHRLSGNQRTCLYRGIASQTKAGNRKSKLTDSLKKKIVHIDGYNVIFTIMNYLLGKILFISNDGFLRDAGESFGRIENDSQFFRSAKLLVHSLPRLKPEGVIIYLDATVKKCQNHKEFIENEWPDRNIPFEIILPKKVDSKLKNIPEGIIATSDSEIIDSFSGGIVDLARNSLESSFKLKISELGILIK